MQLSKKENARKWIRNGSSVQIKNSVTWVTVRHHSSSPVISNGYPRDGIFSQHLTTIKDSYIPWCTVFESAITAFYKYLIIRNEKECDPLLRIRIVYWWNAETTVTHLDQWLGNQSLALTREVNLATQSCAFSEDAIRESGRTFQCLTVWGKKLPL